MIDSSVELRTKRNDFIACRLLMTIDRYEQFAIMHAQENVLLSRIFETAIAHEDYEICQVITELLEERKMLDAVNSVN